MKTVGFSLFSNQLPKLQQYSDFKVIDLQLKLCNSLRLKLENWMSRSEDDNFGFSNPAITSSKLVWCFLLDRPGSRYAGFLSCVLLVVNITNHASEPP